MVFVGFIMLIFENFFTLFGSVMHFFSNLVFTIILIK